ncbi:MAG: hypothetical protein M3Q81_05810, partial [bacterium]|nr:hypothetical protein [bacterium]
MGAVYLIRKVLLVALRTIEKSSIQPRVISIINTGQLGKILNACGDAFVIDAGSNTTTSQNSKNNANLLLVRTRKMKPKKN